MKSIFSLLVLCASAVSVYAQDFSVSGPRTKMNLDVNGAHYTFFNLETGNVVPVSDSATTNWHIAFRKTDIIVNSGTAGIGTVGAQIIEQPFLAVVNLPTGNYVAEDSVAKAIPSGSGNGWYNYNPSTHTVSAKANTTIALHWNGGYALVEMLDYNETVFGYPTGETGYVSFRYQYSASTDVSQKYTQVNNLYAGNDEHQHFDFFNADLVDSSELTDENWQIGFLNTDIILNGGTSGGGITQGQMVDNAFDEVLYAPEDGYRIDAEDDPAVPGGTDNGWYHYDFLITHTVTPLENKVLVVDMGRKYTKMEFLSYYKDAPENPVLLNQAKYYTFKYYLNPRNSNELDHRAQQVGVNEFTKAVEFAIFPNPVMDQLVVKNSSNAKQFYTLYNTHGQAVYSLEVNGQHQAEINCSELPQGVYYLSNQYNTKTILKK